MPRYKYLDWTIPYTPGVLAARGYDGGRLAAQDTLRTAGAPAGLRLIDEFPHPSSESTEVTLSRRHPYSLDRQLTIVTENCAKLQGADMRIDQLPGVPRLENARVHQK